MSSIDQSNETPSQKSDSLSSSAVSPAAPTYIPAGYNHEVASNSGPRIEKTSFMEVSALAVSHRSSKAVSNDYASGQVDSRRAIPIRTDEKGDGSSVLIHSARQKADHSTQMPRSSQHPQSPSRSPKASSSSMSSSSTTVNEAQRMNSKGDVLNCINSDDQGAAPANSEAAKFESEDSSWRNFCYEHPLHAATSAMLNLSEGANGLGEETAQPGNAIAFHEQYLSKLQSHNAPGSLGSAYAIVHYPHKEAKTTNDLWNAQHSSNDTPIGHKEFHSSQTTHHLAPGHDVFPVMVKKEPEDLTRRSARELQHVVDSRSLTAEIGNVKTGDLSNAPIQRFIANGESVQEVIPRLESIPHPSGSLTSGSVIHLRRSQSSQQTETGTSGSSALDLARPGLQPAIPQYSTGSYSSASATPNATHNSAISAIHSIGMNHTYLSPSGSAYSFLASNENPLYATVSTSPTLLRPQHSPFPGNLNQGSDPFYRDYLPGAPNGASNSNTAVHITEQFVRAPSQATYQSGGEIHETSFVERFIRNHGVYKPHHLTGGNLSVDLPSPDSGIGVDAGTPREQSVVQQGFDYTELCQPTLSNIDTIQENQALDLPEARSAQANDCRSGIDDSRSAHSVDSKSSLSPNNALHSSSRSRSWHDCNRQSDVDKVQIPKLLNQYGFRYFLESPISTSQRREDDRITYINKGQFYGITLEYTPDPERPLKNQTVKSMVMVVFREEKTPEDEAKAWQFWHSRQHSAKQRILDADTKNSTGLVGCIEEVAHNAICVYWTPMESPAKINVAIQCLSTDFSSQKGVKGLPLHLQIDTYDDPRDVIPVFHRGYCQIKVFCDKGAERKTRDEERRAAKRKLVVTGRNKRLDELYHPNSERSEFYHMADLLKPPTLFTPVDHEKAGPGMEMQAFYAHDAERKEYVDPHGCATTSAPISNLSPATNAVYSSSAMKRRKTTPPAYERVMIYVRQENEMVFTPLHLVPPTSLGLMDAIESKYKISAANISSIYRRNCKGILAKVDDEMLKHYCNEDLFILEITTSSTEGMFDITLKDICDA